MNKLLQIEGWIAVLILLCLPLTAGAFDSGSTGADGDLAPTDDVTLAMPLDGVFNFQSVNIPAGVTVRFDKNASNTPVIWLVAGDVTIDGAVDVSAQGRIGGPGGYDGGLGRIPGSDESPGAGQGPGGGDGAASTRTDCSGSGGSYATTGGRESSSSCFFISQAGPTYGRDEIIPLLGGSGGGGSNSATLVGSHGGGGGGAILIAASGIVTINGSLVSYGGLPPDASGADCGGKGSGGAIRVVGTTIAGNGLIEAVESQDDCNQTAQRGGNGRIRLEADNFLRTAGTRPTFTTDTPRPLFFPGFPTLAITSVGGITSPATPTGVEDVTLAPTVTNPVTVAISATGVPLGSEVDVTLKPDRGQTVVATSTPLSGTLEASTATVSMDIPDGVSTMQASVEFTVDSTAAIRYAPFAEGQLVARVRSQFAPTEGPMTVFITADGQEYPWRNSALGIN